MVAQGETENGTKGRIPARLTQPQPQPKNSQEIQKERQRQAHIMSLNGGPETPRNSLQAVMSTSATSTTSTTSLFDNRGVAEDSSSSNSHRQLTLPFLVFSQRQRNGENLSSASDAATMTTVSTSSTSSLSSEHSTGFGGRMFVQTNRSPPTIHCEFPGRACNNCQKDLSSKSANAVECKYCEKTTCCYEECGGCGGRFCRFCVTTR